MTAAACTSTRRAGAPRRKPLYFAPQMDGTADQYGTPPDVLFSDDGNHMPVVIACAGAETLSGRIPHDHRPVAVVGEGHSMLTINLLSALKDTPRTFAGTFRQYLDLQTRLWSSPKTAANFRAMGERWIRAIGGKEIGDVSPFDVLGLFHARDGRGLAAATLNYERALLRGFWRWLRDMGLVEHDPVKAWPRRRTERRRLKLALSRGDIERLLPHLKPLYRRFVLFAAASGLRLGEIRALLWAWIVPGEDGLPVLDLPAWIRKQRRAHRLPLSREALEALGPNGAPGERIFPYLPGTAAIDRYLKRAARRAGLPEMIQRAISVHQLRRTLVRRLQEERGLTNDMIRLIIGWSDTEVIRENYEAALGDRRARELIERPSRPPEAPRP